MTGDCLLCTQMNADFGGYLLMDWKALYNRYEGELEDFWGRREIGPRFEQAFTLFGRPGRVTSNDEELLAAVSHSLPLFSRAPATDRPPFAIHLAARPVPLAPGPPPENLFAITQYSGYGDWLSIHMGGWGHCQVDLAAGRAVAVLAPELAQRPELVSRGLLNTIFTNLVIGSGFGMLHCTGLLRDNRALLLMAPHNSGKSTTALRLVLAGYRLLSDSQIYVSPDSDELQLLGFPVGKVKLRRDMVGEFPELRPLLTAEPVRDETKYSVDLRGLDPELVCTTAVVPEAIGLCLLGLHDRLETTLAPAAPATVWEAVMANSLFYDTAEAWQRNLGQIERLVTRARAHHLTIGADPAGIVTTVNTLSLRP